MSVATAKRFRVALVCLLVLCLSPTAMAATGLGALHDAGADSKPVLFISASSSGAASSLIARSRSRLVDGLDDLLKTALIPGRMTIDFGRKSSPSLFEENTGVFHHTDNTVMPARAPPVYRCS